MFKIQYWVIEDEALAKKLGISTKDQDVGDVYLVRKESDYTAGLASTTKLDGYDFVVQKVASAKEMIANQSKAQAQILNYAFNSPVTVNDFQQFFQISNMFRAITCVVYCDPSDEEQYEATLKSMIKAQKRFPINLHSDQHGDFAIDRTKDVLFVITRSPNLMFF